MKMGAASHPEVVQRQDVLLSGIYHALADMRDHLLPEQPALPRYSALGLGFLCDALAALQE